jgi:hypothetical protein|tara:strand:- start:173 stop:781 length:609 start_codon:yes stop_codon:yes gene_type:complete
MIIAEYKKIKKNILSNFCDQEDETLQNNCLIAELFDVQLVDATDEKPIVIKGGIGELKITKNKNFYTPNPNSWTATASQGHLITYFTSIKQKNRNKREMDKNPAPGKYIYDIVRESIESQPKPPTVKEMSSNFAKATSKWVKSGFKIVTKKQFSKRLEACRSCSFWDESARLGMGKCNHKGCGCTKGKLWMETESCPIEKWK